MCDGANRKGTSLTTMIQRVAKSKLAHASSFYLDMAIPQRVDQRDNMLKECSQYP